MVTREKFNFVTCISELRKEKCYLTTLKIVILDRENLGRFSIPAATLADHESWDPLENILKV